MDIDIFFSDIDGTLVDDEHNVMPETKKIIQKLVKGGKPFILVSARPPMGVRRVLDMLQISSPMICFCGGVITDEAGNIVFDKGIPIDTAIAIKDYFDRRFPDVCACTYLYDRWICDDKNDYWVKYEIGVTGMTPEQLPITELKKTEKQVHKLLCMGKPEEMDIAEAELKGIFSEKAAIYRSKPEYIEVTPYNVSKSNAIRFLCEKYRTDVSHSAAFGDNYNDFDMLKSVGISVAMGNAPEEIKKICSFVTDDNNSEGVFKALLKLT